MNKTFEMLVSLCSYHMPLMRQNFDTMVLAPVIDHLSLTFWVVAYGRFDCRS